MTFGNLRRKKVRSVKEVADEMRAKRKKKTATSETEAERLRIKRLIKIVTSIRWYTAEGFAELKGTSGTNVRNACAKGKIKGAVPNISTGGVETRWSIPDFALDLWEPRKVGRPNNSE